MDNMKSKCPSIREEIAGKNDLLALPDVVIEILELTSKDEISIDHLSSAVSKDPALTGRLLKIANSPFYGLSQQVVSIQQAVMVLGITTVKCLVLSAALFDPNKIKDDIGFDIKSMYGNIVSIAIACRKLAVASKYSSPEDAFTCGLLHEIGLLFFLQNYPSEYLKVLGKLGNSGNPVPDEKTAFGISHPEVGQLIAEKWKLPENISVAIGNHHSFGFNGSRQLDDILRLAVVLNKQYFFNSDDDIEERITKIDNLSGRLGITEQQLDDISANLTKDAIAFTEVVGIEIYDMESILIRANQEIFRTYFSIQKLFKERQELTKSILDEERARGIQDAKQVAISTLSHYINNSAMIISGQSQIVRLFLNNKNETKLMDSLPRSLNIIDEAIHKIAAVLEEISELNMLNDVEYFEKSKILNMDERIEERISLVKEGLSADQSVESESVII
jgi:HD-like signal output (HDOD) protein